MEDRRMQLSEEYQLHSRKWYFRKKEIEDCSPSRKDGIDFMTETQLRKLYCSFIRELGEKLQVPQVTIACALILCHRFYMRQSHAKNHWQTVATVCVFVACKIQETPRLVKDVAIVAYEMIYKWDPSAPQRIRNREFCNKQKELILIGERLVLVTIAFDFDIQLPYKPLVDALKKLEIFQYLGKVAWSLVNDWLCTTLCLQYKPHYIAAGTVFIAAKLKKVKLPTETGKVWWLQFDVSPKQLQEVIQQMLRLLEEDGKGALLVMSNRVPPSRDSVAKPTTCSLQSTVTSTSVGTTATNSSQSTVTSSSVTDLHDNSDSSSMAMDGMECSLKEALPCQVGDSCISSIDEDGYVDPHPRTQQAHSRSSNKDAAVDNGHHGIDTNRIREILKRRKCLSNKKSNESISSEVDIEGWIERELENGLELDSGVAKKISKMV